MWKRVMGHVLWLYLFPPWGLWKLWKDPVLSGTAKWRIIFYLVIIPLLLYAAVSLTALNRTLNRFL